ncbi:FAD:protein FMN transferase [Candidatus Allofournierella merdavium]|uniref:FAD:protein FMN transferase n=1 Tax=Candidatus Allofournierella merdavium TaxID=2838593 RepID=UPI00374E30B4
MGKRVVCFVLSLALCATLLAGCGQEAASASQDPELAGYERYTVTWFDVFDTVTTVIGYAASQEEWDSQMEALHSDLVEYHQLYDIYHTYSGVTNLRDVNDRAGQEPVEVDGRIMGLLTEAKEMCETTGGKMNVAFGTVLKIWHNYREAALDDPAQAAVPSMEELEAAAQHCDINDLILDEEASTVFFADPELQLDVGSVGKGYAVEMVARAAEERGLKSALISVGGNLRSIGHKPDYTRWTGGIQNPWTTTADAVPTESGGYVAVVEVEDMSLVTSGNYQRYYEVDGVRYHHLIDPDTLMPANYYSAVSVLAPDSGLADCLSTGLFCMPLEQGQALVESLEGVEAMWMMNDENDVVNSSGFEASLKQAE